MSEEWRPVVGWEGIYEVSSEGMVRGVPRTVIPESGPARRLPGRILKQKFNRHYWKVTLCRPGQVKYACVHHLVCEAFHGPRPAGQVVRHMNGQYLDNRAGNLKWGTRSENGKDMVRHGTSWWANKTHCPQGHEYNEKNTRVTVQPNGGTKRECRECQRIRSIPRNKARDERKRQQWKARPCRVCGVVFKSAYVQASYCSKSCKDASRRIEFKRGAAA